MCSDAARPRCVNGDARGRRARLSPTLRPARPRTLYFPFQRLYLLAAASEDEGVAALEAHDVLSFEGFFDEYLFYLALRHRVASALLADVYLLCGARASSRAHSVADEPVEYYRVGALHDFAPRAASAAPRSSGARADEPNLAGRHHFPLPQPAREAARQLFGVLGPPAGAPLSVYSFRFTGVEAVKRQSPSIISAYAPTGAVQPPPSSAENPRSARAQQAAASQRTASRYS